MNPKQFIDILRDLGAYEYDIPANFESVWEWSNSKPGEAKNPQLSYLVYTDGVHTALSYTLKTHNGIVKWSTRINFYTPSDIFGEI